MNNNNDNVQELNLSTPGPREPVTREEALEIVEEWERLLEEDPNVPVTTVDLSNRVWRPEVFELLVPLLQDYAAPTVENWTCVM